MANEPAGMGRQINGATVLEIIENGIKILVEGGARSADVMSVPVPRMLHH